MIKTPLYHIDIFDATSRRNPEVAEWVGVLRQRYTGMKLIVGRDKMDEVQGVRLKIQAFAMFLEKYPEYQGKVSCLDLQLLIILMLRFLRRFSSKSLFKQRRRMKLKAVLQISFRISIPDFLPLHINPWYSCIHKT